MKKINLLGILVTVLVTIAVVAMPASADKGRRIAGPICVNLTTGVVRVVAGDAQHGEAVAVVADLAGEAGRALSVLRHQW